MSFKEWSEYMENKRKAQSREKIVLILKTLGWGFIFGIPFGYIWAFNALMN